MRSLTEPQFHMLMALLVIGSLFLDQHVTKILPTWNMPSIGLVTFLLGMVWVTLFAAHRFRNLQERITVLEDRLDRNIAHTTALEDDSRRRRGIPR